MTGHDGIQPMQASSTRASTLAQIAAAGRKLETVPSGNTVKLGGSVPSFETPVAAALVEAPADSRDQPEAVDSSASASAQKGRLQQTSPSAKRSSVRGTAQSMRAQTLGQAEEAARSESAQPGGRVVKQLFSSTRGSSTARERSTSTASGSRAAGMSSGPALTKVVKSQQERGPAQPELIWKGADIEKENQSRYEADGLLLTDPDFQVGRFQADDIFFDSVCQNKRLEDKEELGRRSAALEPKPKPRVQAVDPHAYDAMIPHQVSSGWKASLCDSRHIADEGRSCSRGRRSPLSSPLPLYRSTSAASSRQGTPLRRESEQLVRAGRPSSAQDLSFAMFGQVSQKLRPAPASPSALGLFVVAGADGNKKIMYAERTSPRSPTPSDRKYVHTVRDAMGRATLAIKGSDDGSAPLTTPRSRPSNRRCSVTQQADTRGKVSLWVTESRQPAVAPASAAAYHRSSGAGDGMKAL